MTRDDIAAVMSRVPMLNDFGVGIGISGINEDGDIEHLRESLLNSSSQCTKICEWLRGKQKRKSVNKSMSSYGLKHLVEDAIGEYVTNGQFIAAAIHSGFTYKLIPDSPNVYFGISEKSINNG